MNASLNEPNMPFPWRVSTQTVRRTKLTSATKLTRSICPSRARGAVWPGRYRALTEGLGLHHGPFTAHRMRDRTGPLYADGRKEVWRTEGFTPRNTAFK